MSDRASKHTVTIFGWQDKTSELTRKLARVLQLTPFEVSQRMIGNGPAIVACHAEQKPAEELADQLSRVGVKTLVVDSSTLPTHYYHVKAFRFGRGFCASRPGRDRLLTSPTGKST